MIFWMSLMIVTAFGSDDAWNGLGAAFETAEEARVKLRSATTLDWTKERPGNVLVLVATDTAEQVDSLIAFLRDGGAVIYFAEGTATGAFLDAVGLKQVPYSSHGNPRTVEGDPNFPMLPGHPAKTLFFNMSEEGSPFVSNYPSPLAPTEPGVWKNHLELDGGGGMIFERRVGRGWLMVIGDSSVLIREMQTFHGNKQFLANALRRYCLKEPCSATLIRPNASFLGNYVSQRTFGTRTFESLSTRIQEWVSQVTAEQWMRTLNGGLAVLVAGLMLGASKSREEKRLENGIHPREEKTGE